MILKTKVNVTYNAELTGSQSGIVQGQLGSIVWENDFNKVGVNYTYYLEDGTPIYRNAFFVEGQAIDDFYNAIKSQIPAGLEKRETERLTFMYAFISQMAQTFSIPTTDIEMIEGLIE